MDHYKVQWAILSKTTQTKKGTEKQTKPKQTPKKKHPKKVKDRIATSSWSSMHDYILCVIQIMAQNKPQNRRTKTHQRATLGDRSNKSSMRKPGIPPARIPEITKSSRTGMIFTHALRSKHRQRRVATRVVRNERKVKQGGETWSKVKMTARLRHSGRTQSPLSSPFSIIIIM